MGQSMIEFRGEYTNVLRISGRLGVGWVGFRGFMGELVLRCRCGGVGSGLRGVGRRVTARLRRTARN